MTVLWSVVNGKEHERLKKNEMRIDNLMPLVSALFPGINYYSITGFSQVMRDCVIPVLKKKFPDLEGKPSKEITLDATVEVGEFLPSKGYEWQDSTKWRSKFDRLLKAAA